MHTVFPLFDANYVHAALIPWHLLLIHWYVLLKQGILWYHHQVSILLLLELDECGPLSGLIETSRKKEWLVLIGRTLPNLGSQSFNLILGEILVFFSLLILGLPALLFHSSWHVEDITQGGCDNQFGHIEGDCRVDSYLVEIEPNEFKISV